MKKKKNCKNPALEINILQRWETEWERGQWERERDGGWKAWESRSREVAMHHHYRHNQTQTTQAAIKCVAANFAFAMIRAAKKRRT